MQAPGWFGKLPMLGDFAQRRLPPLFVEKVDAWLSQGMAASREALGEAWLETYLGAPLWCFAWSPEVIDESWWFGVMMPSVDAVGRYFPLVVAARGAARRAPAQRDAGPDSGGALRRAAVRELMAMGSVGADVSRARPP